MDKLYIRIYLLGAIAKYAEILAGLDLPDRVTCDVLPVALSEAPEVVPNDRDAVVVTNDIAVLAHFLSPSFHLINLVYVGNEDELVAAFGLVPAGVKDVWPASTDEQVKRHATLFIQQLKNAYDAWLYETFLMSLIDSLPDLIWYKEANGLHNLVNRAFCEAVGKSREDIKDRDHCFIWNAPPESAHQCEETDNAVMMGGKTVVADELVETRGEIRQFTTYKSPVFGRDGQIIGTVGLGNDVTNFMNMGVEMTILLDNLPYPVAIVDRSWHMVRANSLFCEAFDLAPDDISTFDYPSWRDSLKSETVIHEGSDGTKSEFLYLEYQGKDGTRYYDVNEPIIVDYFGNPSGHYCLLIDVTSQYEASKKLSELASTDTLTGFYNHRRLFELLSEREGEPIAVLYMDLDNFKQVNDRFGHAEGDEVLRRAAQTVRKALPDGILARQGGDEFVCVLPGTWDAESLGKVKNQIRRAFEAEFSGYDSLLGISVGSAYGDGSVPTSELLAQADRSMYLDKAKHHAVR